MKSWIMSEEPEGIGCTGNTYPLTPAFRCRLGAPVEVGCIITHIGPRLYVHAQIDADAEPGVFLETGIPLVENMIPGQVRALAYRKCFRHSFDIGQWGNKKRIPKCVHNFMLSEFPDLGTI